jgi:hypothetical protein
MRQSGGRRFVLRPRLQRWWMRFWYSVQGYGRAEWDGENLRFPDLEKDDHPWQSDA